MPEEAPKGTQSTRFRSVLPHEPPPTSDDVGYMHLQGALEPRKKDPEAPNFWTSAESLKNYLDRVLIQDYKALNLPHPALSLEVVDPSNPPFTKIRLKYENAVQALAVQHVWRHDKLSPARLFAFLQESSKKEKNGTSEPSPCFSSGSFQVTVVTKIPMPTNMATHWPRSNPPKFRRLLHDHNDQERRSTTRFLYITGLLPESNGASEEKTKLPDDTFWKFPYACTASIRRVLNRYDTSGLGVEVFLSRKKNQSLLSYSCHVGMRSSEDCQAAVQGLQGTSVSWEWEGQSLSSGLLFVDYASICQKSLAKSKARNGGQEWERGQPSRPECTSTTDSVQVPGLLVIEDFLSTGEDEVLMAALTGPQAPWAPDQNNMSNTGAVKRLVQHYGYVFDYQTADVLRDRTKPGAGCPPMPQYEKDSSCEEDVQEGRGWKVFANMIERTRKYSFEVNDTNGALQKLSFPDLNQCTVNHYKPGEGIGSHVDTPSAFGDGLISISLNSGIVMEFRKVVQSANDSPVKKLVYLPPRSLVIMTGPARYEWEHHIVTRQTDTHCGEVLHRGLRVSLTLRTALTEAGQPLSRVESNRYPPKWATEDVAHDPKSFATPPTERDHVHAVYDAIATQWHHTRGKRGVLWPGATQFLQRLPPGSMVADCGCGDGKYFPAIIEAGSYVIGTDISRPLLETAFLKHENPAATPELRRVSSHREFLRDRPAVAVADCMSVPLRNDSCDAAICIAVMHHLSTRERRVRCVEELVRVVRPGGTINIQAWAMKQDDNSRRRFAGSDVFVPFNAQPKYLDKVETKKGQTPSPNSNAGKSVAEMYSETYTKADFDEKKGLVVFNRYCHLYREGELENIVGEVRGARLLESGYESGNYFVILEVVS